MATKTMSLRLPEELAAELAAVARTDDVPIAEAIREAIQHHITARRADHDFQKRLRHLLQEDRKVFKRLSK